MNYWNQDQANQVNVKVTPKFVIQESKEPPVLVHIQTYWLYQYDCNIPLDFIEEIKSLPRESLLKDLQSVLFDSIARYKDFKKLAGDDYRNWFPIHALLLMKDLRATESLETILDFLSQDENFLDFWLGDILTEEGWSIILMCGSHNLNRLDSFIKEPGHYTWSRTAIGEAVCQAALHNIIPHEKAVDWLCNVMQYFLQNRQTENLIDSNLNGSLICDCIDLAATETLPIIKKMLDEKIAPLSYAGDWTDIQEQFKIPVGEWVKKKIENINETYKSLLSREEKEIEISKPQKNNSINSGWPAPIVNDHPKIGRNDLCPCGSGKKYKKCHGGS